MQRVKSALMIITMATLGIVWVISSGASSTAKPGNNTRVNRIGKALPPDAAPPPQQIYRYFVREPKTLDVSLDNYGSAGAEWLFERLTMFDENDLLIPGAAERWESSPDGRRWTFHLRKGARWSDGRPVTAADFEYTYKRFLDPNEGNVYAFLFYDIKNARAVNTRVLKDRNAVGVRAVDDLTFVVETEKPCPYLPFVVAYGSAAPVPRWQVEKYGRRWTEPGKCVTNFSWKLATWEHDEQITFVLDPNYNGRYKGFLEQVVMKFFTGSSPTLLPYENGEIDLLEIDVANLNRIERDPTLRSELHKNPHYRTWYLFFQTAKPPFSNLKVRQAISHAIDRETICRVVLRGLGTPAYTMLPPNFPGSVGKKYKSIQAYDPALAKRLLAEAGYPGGKGFPRVEFWLRDATPNIRRVAEAIQGMLRDRLGIQTVIRNQEVGVYMNVMYKHEIPMSLISFQYDYPDPHNLLTMVWHSQPVGHGRHDWKYPLFDGLVDRAAAEMNHTTRFQMYDQAEKALTSDVGGAFIFHDYLVTLRKPWVKGIPRDQFGQDRFWSNHITNTRLYIGRH